MGLNSGLIAGLMGLVFGGGRNALAETAQVFRENAEAASPPDWVKASSSPV